MLFNWWLSWSMLTMPASVTRSPASSLLRGDFDTCNKTLDEPMHPGVVIYSFVWLKSFRNARGVEGTGGHRSRTWNCGLVGCRAQSCIKKHCGRFESVRWNQWLLFSQQRSWFSWSLGQSLVQLHRVGLLIHTLFKARLCSVRGIFHQYILQVGSFEVPAVESSNVGGKVPLWWFPVRWYDVDVIPPSWLGYGILFILIGQYFTRFFFV